MLKLRKKAPLPFTGQKRNFISVFAGLLQQNIPDKGAGWTVVDTFGGSGLLAHAAKRTLPDARVIYNDFDGFAQRIDLIPKMPQSTINCLNLLWIIALNYVPQKNVDI